jgi:hypothetical protein
MMKMVPDELWIPAYAGMTNLGYGPGPWGCHPREGGGPAKLIFETAGRQAARPSGRFSHFSDRLYRPQ